VFGRAEFLDTEIEEKLVGYCVVDVDVWERFLDGVQELVAGFVGTVPEDSEDFF
jgi:hypothetical protein